MTAFKKPSRRRGPRPDTDPDVVPAGTVVGHHTITSAKACFDWDSQIANSKYAVLDSIPHGGRHLHPEYEKIKELSHGVRMERKDSAVDERDLLRERMYHRKEHQPLGRSAGGNVVLPSFAMENDFRFGKLTHKDEEVSKIMYPQNNGNDDAETIRRYVLSHGSFQPGEQKRHYGKDWSHPEYRESVEHKRLENDGNRVQAALYWKENRRRELEHKIISAGLASFHSRHQPEIGKDTMAHLPSGHTFGIKNETSNMHLSDLMGSGQPQIKVKETWKNNAKRPAAGLKTHHSDDLDLQKHIVPILGPKEDASIVRKITEDIIGGTVPRLQVIPNNFDSNHVFGVPTVRDPKGRIGKGPKRLADKTNYGDELGAKGLMYPTPRNVYGEEQLRTLEEQLRSLKLAAIAAV